MESKSIKILVGWNAFVNDGKCCIGYREFKKEGQYFGSLKIINKPTEKELKEELSRLKIILPK